MHHYLQQLVEIAKTLIMMLPLITLIIPDVVKTKLMEATEGQTIVQHHGDQLSPQEQSLAWLLGQPPSMELVFDGNSSN